MSVRSEFRFQLINIPRPQEMKFYLAVWYLSQRYLIRLLEFLSLPHKANFSFYPSKNIICIDCQAENYIAVNVFQQNTTLSEYAVLLSSDLWQHHSWGLNVRSSNETRFVSYANSMKDLMRSTKDLWRAHHSFPCSILNPLPFSLIQITRRVSWPHWILC